MNLNIGTNIRRLRLEKGLTQEQLAELLCVSTAAVSKWESKNTYPDITLLFPLASIFGVSIDELMGYDEAKAEEEINSILEESRRQFVEGKFKEEAELIENARKTYPHDYRIMSKYMWIKAGGRTVNSEMIIKNKEELSEICDCIMDSCTNDSIRAEAINMKAKILHATENTDAALDLLSTLPITEAALLKESLFDKDSPEFMYWNKKNCYGMLDSVAIKIARIIRFDPCLAIEEKVERLTSVAEAFSEMSVRNDLEFFSIGEQAIFTLMADMLTQESADIEDIIVAREKQFCAMKKTMACAENDVVLRELIADTYKTNDLISWQVQRLLTSTHSKFAELRKNSKYVKMLDSWAR